MRIPTVTMGFLAVLTLNGMAAGPALASMSDLIETISEAQARAIAWSAGLVHVEEILRSGDRWEVAGRDINHDEMMLDIDIRNGRILD